MAIGVPAVFTWVLLFFFQDVLTPWNMFVRRQFLWFGVCAPILHFSFQQFLDFSSGGGLLRPVKERRPLIVTACLNTVFAWGWSMAKIWQGKGTASWFFLLFGSAFMYFVGDGDNVWDAFLVCWQLFFLGFLSWFLAGLVGPDGC